MVPLCRRGGGGGTGLPHWQGVWGLHPATHLHHQDEGKLQPAWSQGGGEGVVRHRCRAKPAFKKLMKRIISYSLCLSDFYIYGQRAGRPHFRSVKKTLFTCGGVVVVVVVVVVVAAAAADNMIPK